MQLTIFVSHPGLMNWLAHLTHGDFLLAGCAFAAGLVTGPVLTCVQVAKARVGTELPLRRKAEGSIGSERKNW